MKSVHTYKDAIWIELENPTVEEVGGIAEEYKLDRVAADDLLSPSARHRVEFAEKYAHLVLHFPSYKESEDGDAAYEFDLVIGDNFIVTARYGGLNKVEGLIESFSEDEREIKNPRNRIVFGVFSALLADFDNKLVEIDHWIRNVEKDMFAGSEKKTIFELSEASRHLTDFRKISSVYPEVFKALEEQGAEFFGKEFSHLMAELAGTYAKHRAKLEVLAEAVRELRDTNDALLSTKQNELMKWLTLISVLVAVFVGIVLTWLGYLAIKH